MKSLEEIVKEQNTDLNRKPNDLEFMLLSIITINMEYASKFLKANDVDNRIVDTLTKHTLMKTIHHLARNGYTIEANVISLYALGRAEGAKTPEEFERFCNKTKNEILDFSRKEGE